MAHVNNAVYLDWAEEAIRAAGIRRRAAALDARPAALAARVPRRRRRRATGRGPSPGRTGPAGRCRIEDAATGEPFLGAHLVRPDRPDKVHRVPPVLGPPDAPGAPRHRSTAAHAHRTAPRPGRWSWPRRDVRPGTAPDRAWYHRRPRPVGDHRAMAPRAARAATIAPRPNDPRPELTGRVQRRASLGVSGPGDDHGTNRSPLAILAVALVGALVGTAGYAATIGRRQMRRIVELTERLADRDRPDRGRRHGQGRRRPPAGRLRPTGRADGPGLDAGDRRSPDRRPQPPGAARPARGRARPGGSLPAAVLDHPRRPRPLQAGQRHPRPRRRRRRPARGRRRPDQRTSGASTSSAATAARNS